MYTFSSKLKTFSFILMVVGILGIGYGFLNAPKTTEDVEKILASDEHHGGGHHAQAEAAHEAPAHEAAQAHQETPVAEAEAPVAEKTAVAATAESHDSIAPVDSTKVVAPVVAAPKKEKVVTEAEEHAAHQAHLEHVLHQLQNKPWSAVYVSCIFFLLLTMGTLAFYAIQQVAQAGWSPVLFRVMQGITSYLPVGSVILLVFLIAGGLHLHHLFPWLGEGVTDPKSPNYDEIIAGKSGYLNFPFWIIRAIVFLLGWNLYRHFSRKNCLAQDEANDNAFYKKNFNISAMFLVFFIVSESIMSWDWIMSLDPHWFSTLFGWCICKFLCKRYHYHLYDYPLFKRARLLRARKH